MLSISSLFLVNNCTKDDDIIEETAMPLFNPAITYGTMTDIDGNNYKTLNIGDQTWMAENLNVSNYNDGTSIPNVTDETTWTELSTGAMCNYENMPSFSAIYGKIYNWYAVNTGKLCPAGWHVATDEEWTTLTNYLGGTEVAGAKLKETDTTHWAKPNSGATNETGFTALPAGARSEFGTFISIHLDGTWWTATESDKGTPWFRYMFFDYCTVLRNYGYGKRSGLSVRCVKD